MTLVKEPFAGAAGLLESAPAVSCSFSVALVQVFADTMASHYDQVTALSQSTIAIYPTTKAEFIREKILAHYFTNVDATTRVFVNVDTTILPSAMEWIGRDCVGFTAMYTLLRGNAMNISSLISNLDK
ncbi:hypothetical protein ACHAWU_006979 [Discostella pseudostelligera]|uniref:Uncharacterized protein n=1 Tax=Discostella pseudostelligera TaxID=259834 RepID=A0ABD3MU46_9STRA